MKMTWLILVIFELMLSFSANSQQAPAYETNHGAAAARAAQCASQCGASCEAYFDTGRAMYYLNCTLSKSLSQGEVDVRWACLRNLDCDLYD